MTRGHGARIEQRKMEFLGEFIVFNGAGVRTLRGADRSVDDYNYEPRVCPRGGGV